MEWVANATDALMAPLPAVPDDVYATAMYVSEQWGVAIAYLDKVDVTPAALAGGIAKLSEQSGVSDAELRLLACLLAAYPIGAAWRACKPPALKHLISVALGWWMMQFVIGYQWVHCLIPCLLAYACMAIVGPGARHLVFAIALGYLAGGHIYRMYTDYLGWTLDWTMQMMIITQKLSAFGYNYYDGSNPKASELQKSRAFSKLPGLVPFLSYILFPANVTIGPFFEFSDYMTVVEEGSTGMKKGAPAPPSPLLPSMWRLLQGILFMIIHNGVMMYLPTWAMVTSPQYMSRSNGNIVLRYAKVWVSLLGYRFKYYFGWKIAEGAAVMSGLGYNGAVQTESGQVTHLWNRIDTVDVLGFETAQSLRDAASTWNKMTNNWLKDYVYVRTPEPFNLYMTYFTSAFWHGFYPGYYMFFLSVAFATQVHRNFRRSMRGYFVRPKDDPNAKLIKAVYDLFGAITTSLTVNYFILSFVALAWDYSIQAFDSLYWYGHILLAVLFVVFGLGLVRPPKKTPVEKKSQ
ncbi:Lysophospholipid acyltransferase [Porphyridium purpureum]|uniref:Lysophospholipid acyltransferase n=1 Tax=Porphyridium purpureum TaxID=35688 RepID=A0A5J4YZN4_PORPP|nr:Lysophospholipid acyltransferase [Porphyridium purpureum]|eukprot:POR2957..scf208_2